MADKKEYKVAPRVALTTKGGIIDDGTVVTAENFASETVFNELVKKGKIVTSEDYIKKVDELNNPEKAAEAEAKKKAEEEAKKAAQNGNNGGNK